MIAEFLVPFAGLRLQPHIKAEGKNFIEAHHSSTCRGGEDNRCIWRCELGQHLPACTTGRARGIVQVGYGNSSDPDAGTELADRFDESRSLGANRETEAHVLDVGPGDYLSIGEQKRSANLES